MNAIRFNFRAKVGSLNRMSTEIEGLIKISEVVKCTSEVADGITSLKSCGLAFLS